MADIEITCIRKPHPSSSHEHITHVGSGGITWTREQVISWIDSRTNTYHTMVGGRRADVGVIREQGHQPFLRTFADGQWNNNLLALAQC
jgi:hypothetical protein